jgi:hypothetical protein
MEENHLKSEVIEFLNEQDFLNNIPTKLLCLFAGMFDYSFSDDMLNELSQFMPSEDEINKIKNYGKTINNG